MEQDVSLGEFMEQLAFLMCQKDVPLPFKCERPWHLVFYRLKKGESSKGKPSFLSDLRFDWDGPYPKAREVSNFLEALHWNASITAANPQYETFNLSPDVAGIWETSFEALDRDIKEYIERASEIAQEEFAKEA